MWGRSAPFLWRKFKRKFRSKTLPPESPQRKNTTPRRSTNSKVSKQSGSGRECISATRTNAVCITWFSKFSIIRSTNISPDFAQKSKWPSMSMDRSPCAITAAAFRSTFIRNGRCRPIELVLTNLHAGGKFGQGAYKYSGGLHGVGAKCANALSEWFKAEVSRDGKVYHMAFAKGKTTDKLKVIGEVKNKKTTGTLITFLPDPTIFTITTEFKFERLAARLRELAFLNPGLEITLTDERRDPPKKERFFTNTGSKSSLSNWAKTSRFCIRSRS